MRRKKYLELDDGNGQLALLPSVACTFNAESETLILSAPTRCARV